MLNNLLPTSRPELFQVRRQWYCSVETTRKQGTDTLVTTQTVRDALMPTYVRKVGSVRSELVKVSALFGLMRNFL